MMILDLHWILFHAVVVFGPEQGLLFKPASTYCVLKSKYKQSSFATFYAGYLFAALVFTYVKTTK